MFDQLPYDAPCVPLFALNGFYSGPRLVVTGPDALARSVADLFWERTDLSAIRGSLVIRSEGPDPRLDLPDDLMELGGPVETAHTAYMRVLGRMTALGMIAGRGVPVRWVA